MAYTKLTPHFTPSAHVEEIDEIGRDSSHYLLSIPSGKADQYRLAQLDDYAQLSRGDLPHCSPLNFSLSARVSSDSILGTWGFGLWNNPFGMSIGFGGNPWRFPALPNTVWFFGASEENYLSFKETRAERSKAKTKRTLPTKSQFESSQSIINNAPSSVQRDVIANGFIAQTFRAAEVSSIIDFGRTCSSLLPQVDATLDEQRH